MFHLKQPGFPRKQRELGDWTNGTNRSVFRSVAMREGISEYTRPREVALFKISFAGEADTMRRPMC